MRLLGQVCRRINLKNIVVPVDIHNRNLTQISFTITPRLLFSLNVFVFIIKYCKIYKLNQLNSKVFTCQKHLLLQLFIPKNLLNSILPHLQQAHLFSPVPHPYSPDRHGHAALRRHLTPDGRHLEVPHPGLVPPRWYSGSLYCSPVPRHLLVRHQHVRVLRDLVSTSFVFI